MPWTSPRAKADVEVCEDAWLLHGTKAGTVVLERSNVVRACCVDVTSASGSRTGVFIAFALRQPVNVGLKAPASTLSLLLPAPAEARDGTSSKPPAAALALPSSVSLGRSVSPGSLAMPLEDACNAAAVRVESMAADKQVTRLEVDAGDGHRLVRALLACVFGAPDSVDKAVFASSSGAGSVACVKHTTQGSLWMLRNGLAFGPRTGAMYLGFSDFASVSVGRHGSLGSTFDLNIALAEGAAPSVQPRELSFGMIPSADLKPVQAWMAFVARALGGTVRADGDDETAAAAAAPATGQRGGSGDGDDDDDDDDDDDEFGAGSESDSSSDESTSGDEPASDADQGEDDAASEEDEESEEEQAAKGAVAAAAEHSPPARRPRRGAAAAAAAAISAHEAARAAKRQARPQEEDGGVADPSKRPRLAGDGVGAAAASGQETREAAAGRLSTTARSATAAAAEETGPSEEDLGSQDTESETSEDEDEADGDGDDSESDGDGFIVDDE
ncbi:hypothetical protein FNF27_04344 [Cafeteria roenbergensis]|nr:hypothetical protein FNF27_04344 [Cafeteria roenbergensis]